MYIFNLFLYLMFVFSPQQYESAVSAGAPCYGYAPQLAPIAAQLGVDESVQPVCPYDPTNTNQARGN